MKTYQVRIKAVAEVLVAAETAKQASLLALEETRSGDTRFVETDVLELTTPEEIAQAKRHADKVVKGVA